MFERKVGYFHRIPLALTSVMLAALVAPLAACNHFFGHDQQVRDPLTVQEQGMSCVRTVGADAAAFMNGEDRDPVAMADCLSAALGKFASTTHGANPDGWTRGELATFFETYFKDESEKQAGGSAAMVIVRPSAPSSLDVSWTAQARRRAMITEIFRWKAALLGGGVATLSRTELARVRQVLEELKTPLAQWRGQGQWLMLKAVSENPQADIAHVTLLTTSVRQVGEILSRAFSGSVDADGISHGRDPIKLELLVNSLEDAGLHVFEAPERKALVKSIKSVVLGGDPLKIGGDEWGELAHQAAELWISAIRIRYGILMNSSAFDRDLSFVKLSVSELTDAMGRMVDRHGGLIKNDDLRELLTQLDANQLFKSPVKAKTINDALEVIFGKLFGGNWRTDRDQMKLGLQKNHLTFINEFIAEWAEGQKVALELAGPAETVSTESAKRLMSQISARELAKPSLAGLAPSATASAILQMQELILTGRPLVHDADGRLIITRSDHITGYTRLDLETLNITRVLINIAMRAFAHEQGRAGTLPTLTESEIQELFVDLKGLGRDLGIVDVRSLQSGTRTFMEVNIFLSVSDGNNSMSLHEMVEWFETALAAGHTAELIHADMIDEKGANCGTFPLDVFGKKRLKADCFRKNLIPIFRNRMSHLPNFQLALNRAEVGEKPGWYHPNDWFEKHFGDYTAYQKLKKMIFKEQPVEPPPVAPTLFQAMERASRALGDTDLPIESSDIRVMSVITHYGEILFARYDADESHHLESREVWNIFPLIQPFVQRMMVDSNGQPVKLWAWLKDDVEKGVFSWLLAYGEPPVQNWLGKMELICRAANMHLNMAKEEAGFEDVIKILASFSKVGRDKKNSDVIKYYAAHSAAWNAGLESGDAATMTTTLGLFQCAAEARGDLTRLIQTKRADLFAVNPAFSADEQADSFLLNFKKAIQSDLQLQLLCMAF